jgi:hypothetical protein
MPLTSPPPTHLKPWQFYRADRLGTKAGDTLRVYALPEPLGVGLMHVPYYGATPLV